VAENPRQNRGSAASRVTVRVPKTVCLHGAREAENGENGRYLKTRETLWQVIRTIRQRTSRCSQRYVEDENGSRQNQYMAGSGAGNQ